MTKPKTQYFNTVAEMLAVPDEKIDHFCEDLRRWLHLRKGVSKVQDAVRGLVEIQTPIPGFGWVDDGKHEANIRIEVGEPQADDAVARSDGDSKG